MPRSYWFALLALVATVSAVAAVDLRGRLSLASDVSRPDATFSVYCPHAADATPSSPALQNCGNKAGARFWLDIGGPGDKVTQFSVSIQDLDRIRACPAHIYVNKGVAEKRWDTSVFGVQSEAIEKLDRIGLHVFEAYKHASKEQFNTAYDFSLRRKKTKYWLKKCEKTSVKCFVTLPKTDGDSSAKYTATKEKTFSKSEFVDLPAESAPAFSVKNVYEQGPAELDEVPESDGERRPRETKRNADTGDVIVRSGDVVTPPWSNEGVLRVEIDPTPRSSPSQPTLPVPSGWFSVPTHTSTGRWHCGGLPYHPKYQACCPGPAVVPLGERCP